MLQIAVWILIGIVYRGDYGGRLGWRADVLDPFLLHRRQNRRRDHAKYTREKLEKDLSYDGGHLTLTAKEYVHNGCARTRAGGDHDHVETIVAADERDLVGRRRHVLGEQKQKHKERREDVHAEHHFSGRLRRQPEQHSGQTREQHARQYQDVGVEATFALHLQAECSTENSSIHQKHVL